MVFNVAAVHQKSIAATFLGCAADGDVCSTLSAGAASCVPQAKNLPISVADPLFAGTIWHSTGIKHIILPVSTRMAGLAEKEYVAEVFRDVAYFEPFYLKDYIPTISKKQM